MPDARSNVVIIGGGAIGLSIAYHLAHLGIENLLLLERERLTSGTSWHAAGIVGPLRASMNLTELACYALKLFVELEVETGQATGYQQTGGVWLAQDTQRLTELRRIKSMGDRCNLDTEMLTPSDIYERMPYLYTGDLVGGMWVEQDGQVNPVDLCMAYAKAAKANGVEIREHSPVTDIETVRGAVSAVSIADGSRIECNKLIVCAGAWSRQLAAMAGVSIPLVSCEHMYIVTDVIDELPKPCPIIRDLESGIYLKGDGGKFVLGAFEKKPKSWIPTQRDAGFLMFAEDWDHAQPMLEAGIHRAPLIAEHGISHFMNGPESFTPDTKQIMGEAPECRNLFVAAGFNSIGIMSSAGVGKVMARWVRDNEAPLDLWEVDIARLDPLQGDDTYLAQRLPEAVHNQFAMHWPYKQFTTGRKLRYSVWHDQLAARNAVFGAATGWERPLWYAETEAETELHYSYGSQSWWPAVKREVLHCQQQVSLFELSPFTKIELRGDGARSFLERLCCSDIDIAIGQIRYSLMLNHRGGIEAEITVVRLSQNHFRIISGAATRFKDLYWIRKYLNADDNVEMFDVTDDYAVVGVMGPNSENLLRSLSDIGFSKPTFPFSSARTILVNGCEVFAQRLSFVGEPGWELYIPVKEANSVLESLLSIGIDHGLGMAGHFALDACRLEMGYRHWGHDMGPQDTPFETGLEFAVSLNKVQEFTGKRALFEQRRNGWHKQLKLCEVLADDVLILHDEPVYNDQQIIGHCTSGGQGYRTEKTLCFVMFYQKNITCAADCEIEIAGERFGLAILEQAPYPTRMK